MESFEFYNPVRILFGKDQLQKLPEQIDKSKKVLLIYGGGSIFKNGVYDQVKAALMGYHIVDFPGIEPNPHYETAMKAVGLIKEKKIDFLLAVGGGSVIDATKFIAAAALYPGADPWHIVSRKVPLKAALPFGVVLTLPATGSEMNNGAVITRAETHEKFPFGSPLTFPKFSVLLPDAAASLPKRQVANGVVDAFSHVLEQYLTYPVNAPLQDRFAESIMQTLIEVAPKVYANPGDYDAMSNLMWCASMALNGLIGLGVPHDWATHLIGHELTVLHGLDHGQTLAIIFPGMWTVLKEEKKEKLLQYGERIWGIKTGTDDERVMEAIRKTEDFFHSLDVKTKLSDYSVPVETIELIATRLEKRMWKAIGDRQLVTPDVVRKALTVQFK